MSRTLTIALILAAVPAVASAQLSDEERARTHFQTGTSYYDQGRYEEAAQQFRESYALSQRSHILLNVARCLELAGDFGGAADALDEYLAAEPAAPDRRTIEQRSQQLRARAPAQTSSGSDSGGGGGADLTVPAILLGAGGAILAGAVATGVVTLSIQSSLEEDCDSVTRICDASRRSDVDTGQALAITTDVLFGVGGAVAAAGIVFLAIALADGGGDDPSAAAACTGDGCFAAVRGTW